MRPAITKTAVLLMLTANSVGQNAPSQLSQCGVETAAARLADAPKAEAFFEQLRAAVERNNRNVVAAMVRFPLRVNGKYTVPNRGAFLRFYDRVFDQRVRHAIKNQRSECIFGNPQGFMAGNGEVWFEQTRDHTDFKVISVNNDSYPSKMTK
jgi:hypothetical protein